jgi:hypothetical protein
MTEHLPGAGLTFLIALNADPIARELASPGSRPQAMPGPSR